MLLAAVRGRRRWRARSEFVRCDPCALPLADGSIDLVYANLSLATLDIRAGLRGDRSRALHRRAFVFATLGPDSLNELRHAWAAVDDGPHVQRFLDMHDLGDLLIRAGIHKLPVLDVDRLRLEYAGSAALFRDLTATGARNMRSPAAATRSRAAPVSAS